MLHPCVILSHPSPFPFVLPCCDITNDCGIFISIINLIYVATAPAAAFIVRIINAPLQLPLSPILSPLLSSAQPPPASHSYPAIEVIYYFYTFRVCVLVVPACVCVTVCFCGTHFIHYT